MRKRAVFVEDHTGIGEMASNVLSQRLDVEMLPPIASFPEALELLPALKPDLVILDNQLPPYRGIDLPPVLKGCLPQTRWLLYSGYFTVTLLREAIALGVDGTVSKLRPADVLAEGARQLLAGCRFHCEHSTDLLRSEGAAPGNLSLRECHIIEKIAAGLGAKEIAVQLRLSHKTVLNHMVSLRAKTGAESMVDLARYAEAHGFAPHR